MFEKLNEFSEKFFDDISKLELGMNAKSKGFGFGDLFKPEYREITIPEHTRRIKVKR